TACACSAPGAGTRALRSDDGKLHQRRPLKLALDSTPEGEIACQSDHARRRTGLHGGRAHIVAVIAFDTLYNMSTTSCVVMPHDRRKK
ncbi:MAG: hypothetical protein ACYS1E_17600, partial [Planctomycetota bacterium]